MSNDTRNYPIRIHAGHQGGGRRTWKPELMDESEKVFCCEYVRADVAADLVRACLRLLASIHAHAETGEAHPIHTIETDEALKAIAKAEGQS